jgi:diguanylate cyclase (GGDEF)-like protein
METSEMSAGLSPETLLAIIRVQTDIAKAGLDLGAVMDLTTQSAQDLTLANGGVIELEEEGDMVYRAATGSAKAQLGLRLKAATSLSGLCIARREILRCDDSETDPRVDREACRRVGLRSMIVVPLRHGETVIGVIKVLSSQPGFFTETEVRTLSMISDLVSASMFHAAKFQTDELYRMATHDPLTGLPNRALFFDRLRQAMAHALRHNERLAVLNADMDGLKPINDGHGHSAGDAAIRATAERLRQFTRQTDTVARLGGDEFAIILNRVDGGEGVARQCARFTENVAGKSLQFGDQELPLSISIGYALYPDHAKSMEELIDKADSEMYLAKRRRGAAR